MSTVSLPMLAKPAQNLATLRAELDQIDDALHDLLMRRAEIVTEVAALRAKGPVALRPGREAAILHRLLARNHGALDHATLIRVWRDILNGSTAQQQAMRIAVPDPALLPLVRDHFGAQAPIDPTAGDTEALDRVVTGAASVAVLRWPGVWWPELLRPRPGPVYIVARLPFWGTPSPSAMLLTAAEPDPSGDDRTLIAGPASLADHIAQAGLPHTADPIEHGGKVLVEVVGFLEPGDPRLALLPPGAAVVGSYAVPVGEGP